MEQIKKLSEILKGDGRVVFFGGAGVSTESGIPDFRSEQSLYKAKQEYGYSPEEILSHSFFVRNEEIFFDYYKKNLIYNDAKPNKAHLGLAKLEENGKLSAVITQNIDGLHQLAGSKNVYELHGSILRNSCMQCGTKYDLAYIMDDDHCTGTVPKCEKCGSTVKPDVVLFEEALDDYQITNGIREISAADTLIVGGTSLVVYPAAGLISYFKGKNLILINRDETPYDSRANLVIHEKIGKVFEEII